MARTRIGLRSRLAGTALVLLLWAPPAAAAPPVVPGSMSYQGVLLDNLGNPQTGIVSLTLRVYDAIVGGTLLYAQAFSSVPLADGVFSLVLGPAGSATDPPNPDPMATLLVDALAGDLTGTGPDRFLEVTIGASGPLARNQLLAAPFALRAESAASADFATSADVATSALSASAVNGLDSAFVIEIYEHTNLDNSGPGNNDPREGLGDTDGDGIANFVDSDNDNDGIDDSTEIGQGSDINKVTPDVTGFTPPTANGFQSTTVAVQGTRFDPALAVVFGSETPVPSNLTATGFDVQVGPQPPGTKNVQLTAENGEVANSTFDFFFLTPQISALVPNTANGTLTSPVTVQGSDFEGPLTVVIGSQTPVPTNVTATSFDVLVGPQAPSVVAVQVTNGNGEIATSTFEFRFFTPQISSLVPNNAVSFVATTVTVNGSDFEEPLTVVFGDQTPVATNFTPTSFDVLVGPQNVGVVDVHVTNGNGQSDSLLGGFSFGFSATHPAPLTTTTQLSFDVKGVAQTIVGGTEQFAVDTDGDGTAETLFPLATEAGSSLFARGQLAVAWDAAGNVVGLRCRPMGSSCNVEILRDSNASFDLEDETATVLESVSSGLQRIVSTSLAVDSAGGLAAGYLRMDGLGTTAVVAHDRDGDGAFTGVNELVDVESVSGILVDLAELAVGPTGDVASIYIHQSSGVMFDVRVAHDRNGDGDFSDVVGSNPEISTLATLTGLPSCVGAGFAPDGDLAVVYGQSGAPPVFSRDLNGDGDFSDVGEVFSLPSGSGALCDVEGGGPLAVAADLRLFIDRNDDGDFDDLNENVLMATRPSATVVEIGRSQTGLAFVASDSDIDVDPTP